MAVQHLRPKPWLSRAFAGMTLAGIAGVFDVAASRVVLHDDRLECGPFWARRRHAVSDIQSVTWERGSGVVLKLASGGWGRLPELGYNAQGLASTVRAWLKRRQQAC